MLASLTDQSFLKLYGEPYLVPTSTRNISLARAVGHEAHKRLARANETERALLVAVNQAMAGKRQAQRRVAFWRIGFVVAVLVGLWGCLT